MPYLTNIFEHTIQTQSTTVSYIFDDGITLTTIPEGVLNIKNNIIVNHSGKE